MSDRDEGVTRAGDGERRNDEGLGLCRGYLQWFPKSDTDGSGGYRGPRNRDNWEGVEVPKTGHRSGCQKVRVGTPFEEPGDKTGEKTIGTRV